MADSLVSVVIPTYNRAYCIGRTINSVLAQTHRRLEILVVDDGSSDGTAETLAGAYGGEPRVRVLRQANQGVSAARNHGLRAATGEFVALLDSDDLWLPWKLEAQLACLAAASEAGMVWTDMDAVGPGGEVLQRRFLTTMYGAYRWFDREDLFERWMSFSGVHPALSETIGEPRLYVGDIFSEMVLGNLVHTSTVLLRRDRLERVGGFDPTLRRTGEDYDFHLRTCREGPVAYLDVASIHYTRGQADQLTYGSEHELQMARNFLRTIEPVIERDRDRIRLPRVMLEEVLAEAYAWIGGLEVERGEHLGGMRHLATSLRHQPRQPRVLGFMALNLLPVALAGGLRRLYRGARSRRTAGAGKAGRP
jgi:glycosyltransferase involved in cell wall biosynthesis